MNDTNTPTITQNDYDATIQKLEIIVGGKYRYNPNAFIKNSEVQALRSKLELYKDFAGNDEKATDETKKEVDYSSMQQSQMQFGIDMQERYLELANDMKKLLVQRFFGIDDAAIDEMSVQHYVECVEVLEREQATLFDFLYLKRNKKRKTELTANAIG